MAYVLFHGSFNSRDQLKEFWLPKLSELHETIIFPEFPVDSWEEVTEAGKSGGPKRQTLDAWLDVFDHYIDEVRQQQRLIFVGHSSGPLFILHVLRRYGLNIEGAVFVSPFIDPLVKPTWQVRKVNETLYDSTFDFASLRVLCPKSYVLYGTDDPYVETENSLAFAAGMQSKVVPVPNGGHLNKQHSADVVLKYCKLAHGL